MPGWRAGRGGRPARGKPFRAWQNEAVAWLHQDGRFEPAHFTRLARLGQEIAARAAPQTRRLTQEVHPVQKGQSVRPEQSKSWLPTSTSADQDCSTSME